MLSQATLSHLQQLVETTLTTKSGNSLIFATQDATTNEIIRWNCTMEPDIENEELLGATQVEAIKSDDESQIKLAVNEDVGHYWGTLSNHEANMLGGIIAFWQDLTTDRNERCSVFTIADDDKNWDDRQIALFSDTHSMLFREISESEYLLANAINNAAKEELH